jgi:hypothetical protein
MVELLAAAAVSPWTHPLAFRPPAGWRTGRSGTVASRYDHATAQVPAPKESTAWMATRDVRYRDGATEDPPNRTLARLPRGAVIVWAVIFQTHRPRQRPIRLDMRYAKHFACCEGARVAGGGYDLVGSGGRTGYSVIVRIYFGSPATRATFAKAQAALDHLQLPRLR